MSSSLSRRGAVWIAIATCGFLATTCGAPSHTFYDDTKAGTGIGGSGGRSGVSTSTGSAGSGGAVDGGSSTGGSSTGGSSGVDASTGAAGSGVSTGGGAGASTGGTAGSGGGTGTAGTGGAKLDGGGGSAGGKADAGAENCFDNIDNNGDSLIDCADPVCASVATCVTEEPNHALGVLVDATAACPAGTTATAINRGITGGACTGCTCTANPVACSADVFLYDTAAQCMGDTTNTGGTNGGRLTGACVQPTTQPFFQGNKAGIRVALNVSQTCGAAGTGTPTAAHWTSAKKLCVYANRGGGCVAGKRCVPKQTDPATQCAVAAGSTATCSGFATTQNDWYTGFSDTRTCGACGCTAMGGACQNAHADFGSDYVCTDSLVSIMANTKLCGMTSYSPPAGFYFTPVNPTCTASATQNGALTPTGAETLCCNPG